MRWASPVDGWCDETRKTDGWCDETPKTWCDETRETLLDFGAKKARAARYIIAGSCSFQNGHYKNAANDRNCLFPAAGCTIFCIIIMQLHGLLFLFLLYRKRNIDLLATHFARKRNLFVKVQGIEITCCTLAGLMGRADPANGLARLSCNREVDFCCV